MIVAEFGLVVIKIILIVFGLWVRWLFWLDVFR